MKLSMLPCSIFSDIISEKISLKEWIDTAKDMGCDGFDCSAMFFKQHTPTYLASVRRTIDEGGLPFVMMCTYPDFTHPDPLQREREQIFVREDIARASILGAKYLRITAGQEHEGTSRKDGIRWAVEGIKAADEFAQRHNVRLLYEDHSKPGAWDNFDFSYPIDIFLEIFEGIKDTGVGINYDIGNADACGYDSVEILRKVIDKVETVHVTDMAQHGKLSQTLIGTGVTPIKECFTELKSHGFEGWVCIEEASGMGLEGMKKAYEATRRLWKEA